MKKLVMILSLISFATSVGISAYAAETVTEKAEAKTNNVKRAVKKKIHRTEEVICEKTDENCFAKKAANRAKETKEYAKDKVKEGANVIDNDKKKSKTD